MTLSPGRHLGPYEIMAPLGAGGMGDVYRARDGRLGRDVAIKVLPDVVARDPEALSRFEREARAVAALNHPGILSLFDIGTEDGTAYAVLELLQGETLGERLARGALPVRKAVEHAAALAQALAAAHEKGIVHRDLKPDNIFLMADGRVKLLDFGLATHRPPTGPGDDTSSPTLSRHTDPGTILGTVGYMSPEQVRGQSADGRSDIFALGCVLLEMLTGRRAFRRGTAAETMTAILNEDPLEPRPGEPPLPAGLEVVLRHCLEKNPAERFQSARDLAFDLEQVHSVPGTRPAEAARPARRWASSLTVMAVGLALFGGGLFLGRGIGVRPPPAFRQLTFQRARVGTARFTPDGQTVVYALAKGDQPLRVESSRLDSIESRALELPLPPADVLGVSRTGELGLILDRKHRGTWISCGTLARVGLAGGTPREVLEGVCEGDIAPDATSFAVVRQVGALQRLEYPIGHAVFETHGWISDVRIAPDGRRLAFADHPDYGNDAGHVALVEADGPVQRLTPYWESVRGLTWTPDGREIWFTASGEANDASESSLQLSVQAVQPGSPSRQVYSSPSDVRVQDISAKGDVLIVNDLRRADVGGRLSGDTGPRDLTTWRDEVMIGLSWDGSVFSGMEMSAAGADRGYILYYRRPGGDPVRVGKGNGLGVSPDGKWVLAVSPVKRNELLLIPTGPGEPRALDLGRVAPETTTLHGLATWTADGRRFAITGREGDRPPRTFIVDVAGGAPRAVTREGTFRGILSPDGAFIAAADGEERVLLYPAGGGEPKAVSSALPGDMPLQWEASGQTFYVWDRTLPMRVFRVDPFAGRRELHSEIALADPAGAMYGNLVVTPDGRHYAYRVRRMLGELYLARGLR